MRLFWKDTITYVDTLHEWRNILMNVVGKWDFKLLDLVWVVKTMNQSEYSHPWHSYYNVDRYKSESVEGIIIGLYNGSLYAKEWYTDKKTIDGWIYHGTTYDGKRLSFKNEWWKILLKDGRIIEAHTIKKSHGEFQETFDHMEEWERKKKLLDVAQEKYTEALQDMDDHLKKWREFHKNMIQSITGK